MGQHKRQRHGAGPATRPGKPILPAPLPEMLGQALQQAVRLHQGGQLAEARAKYLQVLKAQPRHPDALNLCGLAAYQEGGHQQAVEMIAKAVKINPGVAEYHSNLGMAWRALGDRAKAIKCYRQALALSARTPGLHYNLANVLKDDGQLEQAVREYEKALDLSPDYPEAHNNLGAALRALGRLDEALAHHRQAVKLRPAYPEGLNSLGSALSEMGQAAEAVECFRRAVGLAPDNHRALYNLSSTLIGLSRPEQAVEAARAALAVKPDYAEAINNLGVALSGLGRADEAIAEYKRALELEPDYAEALSNLAMAYTGRGLLEEAATCARRAVALKPDFAEAYNNLANALKDAGKLQEAFAHYRQAVHIKPDYAGAESNLLMCLNYEPTMDEEGILAAHVDWDRRHGLAHAPRSAVHGNDPDPQRRLRLGYVSADFYRHTVSYYLLPVLAAHDHSRFEVFCYSARHLRDDMTERLRAHADAWRPVAGLDDDEVAQMIRRDGIDILIDLSGHTAHNRLPVFARKPAPVQASWLGYFNTTGMSAMDYILMDPWTVPMGEERWFSEEVVRLPHGRFCYAAPEYAPAVAPLPCLSRGAVTFASFNNLTKVTTPVIQLWSRLLLRVAGARLLLKWKSLADAAERERLWQIFEQHGVERARVELRGPSPHPQMLAEYGDVDIGLDPFPFSGGVTSCEALWMGVPIVTWPGRRPVSRQTLGFLSAVGLPELAAADQERYLDIAADLASQPQRLARLRATLRARMAASPLCDGPMFTRAFEDALRGLWRGWCARSASGPAQDPGAGAWA